jgi:hypothetical protein
MRKPALFLLAAMLAGISPASAQVDRLRAYSNTAISITGDVTTDDFEIVFENGERLAFSDLVADRFVVDGGDVPASVYRIETPADPELLNGNRLCGAGDVTYLANWLEDELTVIAVFTGDEPPRSDAEMCASYYYEYYE